MDDVLQRNVSHLHHIPKGQSVTHKKFNFVSSIKPNSLANLTRNAPKLCATTFGLSATNITKSPASAPVNVSNVSTFSVSKKRPVDLSNHLPQL